ncbi:Gag-Pol polyprotein [Labeo rohita]|uniref:Gag-Pol polyprotein n=1 Tax=Labeo rohita TaxID=84645 RepID=A0ABQ8L5F6_LABRO|nr:Gag-Pol polyprotein [Labeo rohita]
MTDTEMADGTRCGNDNGLAQRQRDGKDKQKEARKESGNRVYLKEATVTVDVGQVKDARAVDIIKAVVERIGDGRILAVRPKQMKEYEITLEHEDDTELLIDGLMINGKNCEVKRLQNRDYVVSFMHLPVYIVDEEILNKLEGWGVFPISKIKRRVYPGTSIEDGTRFVRTRFPKEVASLPYSTKFETAEGPQYFRVMHNHQVKTCRLCMSPDHVVKDPISSALNCGIGSEEEDEQRVDGQMHERDNEQREENTTTIRDEEEAGNKDTEHHKDDNEQKAQSQEDGEADCCLGEVFGCEFFFFLRTDKTAKELDMADETRQGNDNGQGQRQRERFRMDKEARKEREYLREVTVTIDVEGVTDLRAMDIIKAISDRIGEGKILAVPSLPYSTKIETAEDPQYFRVMHSHQVKTCRLCMSPDHVVKDCPAFTCFKCGERGHFARNCNAVMCPDCELALDKCECWMESGGERQVSGQMHGGDSEQREEELNIREETGT